VICLDFDALNDDASGLISRRSFLDGFVLPDYDQFNIVNVSSVVGKIFSVNSLMKVNLPSVCVDDFSGVEKVVLFVVDGLGFNRFVSHMEKFKGAFYDLADRGVLKAFSSTFPSTTSTALTSIYTGLAPSIHGVVGFNMYVPDYGVIFNTLDMNPVIGYSSGIDLVDFFAGASFPWPSMLLDAGIKVKTFTRRNLAGSGLSRLIHRQQDMAGYALVSDMMVGIRRALEQPGPLFLSVYYAGVDTLEHSYGPYTEEVSAELQLFENLLKSQLIEKLSTEEKQKTLLLLTADHGVVDVLQTYFLNDPKVSDHFLLPPTGDMRSTYFFPKYGRKEQLRGALENTLQGFRVVESMDLIERGAFGPVKNLDHLQTIVGELTALSQSKNIILHQYHPGEKLQGVYGAHGGMTPEEMIVPLLSTRLSKL